MGNFVPKQGFIYLIICSRRLYRPTPLCQGGADAVRSVGAAGGTELAGGLTAPGVVTASNGALCSAGGAA